MFLLLAFHFHCKIEQIKPLFYQYSIRKWKTRKYL